MNIEQPLNGMTWGELRAFVAVGKSLKDDEEVVYDYDELQNRASMFACGVSPKGLAGGLK